MRNARFQASTRRLPVAMGILLLACLLAGCGEGSLPVVLRETETLRHLPRGTRIAPPGEQAFDIALLEGAWLVSAAYLSRINELLGLPPAQ